jgi:hypothetical protein
VVVLASQVGVGGHLVEQLVDRAGRRPPAGAEEHLRPTGDLGTWRLASGWAALLTGAPDEGVKRDRAAVSGCAGQARPLDLRGRRRLGGTAPGRGIGAGTALVMEIVLTFGLVTVILGIRRPQRGP